jgi:hypothetical protein
VTSRGQLPALELYDGPIYRVLRRFLSDWGWPPGLLVKVISGKHGLLDVTDVIEPYEQRITPRLAAQLSGRVRQALARLRGVESVFANVGLDYMPALARIGDALPGVTPHHAKGGIGEKMRAMKAWLRQLPNSTARLRPSDPPGRQYRYLFPDWDDYIYEPFTADETDDVRASDKVKRQYAHEVFGATTPYDGLLVSLAQLQTSKGALGRNGHPDDSPMSLRDELRLPQGLALLGDCGAFSYASAAKPPFTPSMAASLYHQLGVDAGASVDHIPLPEIDAQGEDGKRTRRALSDEERRRRIRLTVRNARTFIGACRSSGYRFTPIGVIQGTNAASYGDSVGKYLSMGYEHIALGGLVPRSDAEILEIVCRVRHAIQMHTRGADRNVWVHLFGILRPKLQPSFRSLGVSSFDSASYLRKAWLRSDQNYLAPDASRWYGSIRIPIAASKRMREAAEAAGIGAEALADLESQCLMALESFDGSPEATAELLKSVDAYGPLLDRRGEENHFAEKHGALLRDMPWRKCRCPMCRGAGVNVVVFRGANRNKRRGLHNTWVLYHRILGGHRTSPA